MAKKIHREQSRNFYKFLTVAVIFAFFGSILTMLYLRRDFYKNDYKIQPQYVFVQDAPTGSFVPIDSGANAYRLVLSNVPNRTLTFSDNSAKTVGSISLSDFIASWSAGEDSYASDPPKAILITHNNTKKHEEAIAVELTDPVYNEASRTLTFTATVLSEGNSEGFTALNDKDFIDFPEKLNAPVLLIKDTGWGGN